MQARYRLYRRSNRSHGTYYAQDVTTGARESLGTKNKAEAQKLLLAKNEAHIQPVLSRELAKVYLHTLNPDFGTRTWLDVARLIDNSYDGNTKTRFQKFLLTNKSHHNKGKNNIKPLITRMNTDTKKWARAYSLREWGSVKQKPCNQACKIFAFFCQSQLDGIIRAHL
jgi:hypothetical protein